MKSFLLCTLIWLSAATILAQASGTIRGRIIPPVGRVTAILPDAPDPIKNTHLKLISAKGGATIASTYSDRHGNFVFENVSDGEYYVVGTCNYCSAAAASTEKIRVRSGEAVVADLRLPEQRISETVTIAADAAQPIEELSKTADSITGQQMRDRADITLVDSLRTIPGFRVQQLGGFGRTASIKSRGLRNQDTAVLIDGIRFRDAGSITGDATAFLSDFTLTSVSRVEVLRGPGSSLYGTNAVGGTVDFQTPAPPTGWHGQLSGAFGGLGLGRFRGNTSYGTKDGRFGFNVGASRTAYSEGIDGDDDARNTNFQSRIEFNPLDRINISARFFVSDAIVALNSSPALIGTPPPSAVNVIVANPGINFSTDTNDPDNSQRSRFFSGQFMVNHAISPTVSIQGFYQGLTTERINTNGPLGPGFQPFGGSETDILKGRIHTLNGQLVWTPNGLSATTFGYEFESERFNNDHIAVTAADNFMLRATQQSSTIFGQQRFAFLDRRLQLAAGFRVQSFSLEEPFFEPLPNPTYSGLSLEDPPTAYTGDASASYYVRSTETKLRTHIGNGYRVPSLYERFGTFYSSLFLFSSSGNPYLKPERSLGFDAGVDQFFLEDRIRLTGIYFYTDIDESIDFAFCVPQCLPSPDPFGRFSGYYNTDGRVARGVETSAAIRAGDSSEVFASYTFTNSNERNALNLAIPRSPGVPTDQFTAVVTQRFGKRFWVNFDLLATSSYLFPFFYFDLSAFESKYYLYRFKGNRRADLTAGYTFGLKQDKFSLRVFGTVENLFDNEYFENGFRTAGQTGRIGLSFSF